MMSPTGPRIELRRRVTLTFDPKVKRFILLPRKVNHLWKFAAKSVRSLSKYRVHKICNRRTDGQRENIMPLVPSLACRRQEAQTKAVVYLTQALKQTLPPSDSDTDRSPTV